MSRPFLFPRKPLSAVIVSLLTPNLVSAAQVDWVGATGFWDVASNWSSSFVLPTSVDDAVLNVAGSQKITVRNGSTVNSINTNSGDEVMALTGGTLNLLGAATGSNANGTSSINAFTQTAGTLSGAGNLTISGAAALNGGLQTGTGTTLLKGTSNIGGSIGLDSGRILRNEGSLTWTAGFIDLNAGASGGSGRIDNAAGGVWEAQGSNSIYATNYSDTNSVSGFPAFNNAGTFRKSGATTTQINVAFNNNGTVDVKSGKVQLAGAENANGFINQGSVLVAANSIFETNGNSSRNFDNQGTLGGNGQINVNGTNNRLLNNGEIAPGGDNVVGKLTIDFNSFGSVFQQLALGEMQFDLTSLSSYDQLHISDAGSIVLSGTLQINSLGNYNPNLDDFYTLMTFNSGVLTGGFSNILVSGFHPSVKFNVDYLSNSIVLRTTTSTVPLPGSLWFMLSGISGLLMLRRRR